MKAIGVGVIGTGFMGKAHSVAYSGSASVFGTGVEARLEIVCDLSPREPAKEQQTLAFHGIQVAGKTSLMIQK